MQPTRAGMGVALLALAAACTVAASAANPPVVGCAQSVYGELGSWRSDPNSLLAGPVGWPSLLGKAATPRARSFYGPHKGLAIAVKALLVVEPGRAATVRIPASEGSRLSLLYRTANPRAEWHGIALYRVSDGAAAITFKACARSRSRRGTGFAGDFLARGPQCAVVEVRARGSARWLRRRIPFGKGTCG